MKRNYQEMDIEKMVEGKFKKPELEYIVMDEQEWKQKEMR